MFAVYAKRRYNDVHVLEETFIRVVKDLTELIRHPMAQPRATYQGREAFRRPTIVDGHVVRVAPSDPVFHFPGLRRTSAVFGVAQKQEETSSTCRIRRMKVLPRLTYCLWRLSLE